MKKVMYFLLLFVFSLTSLQSTAQFSETKIQSGEGDDIPILTINEPGEKLLLKDCMYEARVSVSGANIGGPFNDAPPLYIEVILTGEDGSQASDIFEVEGWTFDEHMGPYAEPVFVADFDVSFNVGDICNQPGNNTFPLVVTYNLITPILPVEVSKQSNLQVSTMQEYEPFPVCDHKNVGNLFSCYVFDVPCFTGTGNGTTSIIGGNTPACDDALYNTYTRVLDAHCTATDCEPAVNRSKDDSNNQLATDLFQVTTSANPVGNELGLIWTGNQNGKAQVFIYHSSGRFVESLTLNGTSGNQAMNISNWAKGLYFLLVEKDGTKEVLKVVKQ